ncbi:MAG: cohesin domain-containing protein [bacterium]|nr:cohesin domain-containing protein [bacterium]
MKFFTVISFGLIAVSGLSLAQPVMASGASLYLSPASGSFFVGSTFDVSIFVNTGNENINAVQVDIMFDPKAIQVANPTAGKSFIEVWVAQPTYSNLTGQISFVGGMPNPGINTSAGLVSTITFRAIAPGPTAILFSPSSKVMRNDPDGTNNLTSMGRGEYNLLIPPPEGPKVFSITHNDQNKWYKNNNPTFSWEKEQGVTDFSYSFDQDSIGVPDNISEGDFTSVSYGEVKDGGWYFHIKAKKAGVWGGASHYLARIDATPPAIFTSTVDPSVKTTDKQPLVSFFTTDAFSGISHYELKYIDLTPESSAEDAGFFTEVSSPYKLPSLKIGKYLIVARAYDVAGNWREGTVKIEILPSGIIFTKNGIQYRGNTVYWWILISILSLMAIYVIFYLKKKYESPEEI